MKKNLQPIRVQLYICTILAFFSCMCSFAQAPPALIDVRFNEYVRTSTYEALPPLNLGTAPTTFVRSANLPHHWANTDRAWLFDAGAEPPSAANWASIDFGTTPGNYYVESTSPVNELKNLSAFTITGWVNCLSSVAGSGGNRIISWINNGGQGVDLVYQGNGSLRLGVNGWPDSSPAFSSANKITTYPSGASFNWVFFAVTYQSNGQVQFYFGNSSTNAALDVTRNYPGRGAVGNAIGKLAIGAFNDATRSAATYDRMFRGMIDDITIHGSVLSSQDIISIQRGNGRDLYAPTLPRDLLLDSKTETTVKLGWRASTDNVGVTRYNIYNNYAPIPIASTTSTNITLTNLLPGTPYSLEVRAEDAAGNLSGTMNVSVTTMGGGDQSPPSTPGLVVDSYTQTTAILSWTGSTDNVGVKQYLLYQNDTFLDFLYTPPTPRTVTDLTPGTTYSYYVKSLDAAGNYSQPSNAVTITTNPAQTILPLVRLAFNETSAINNSGQVAATFSRSSGPPDFSSATPEVGGPYSVDFGTTPGNYFIQSSAPIEELKNLSGFTLTGWLNVKSNVAGSGGNRIISWINNGGEGVDLVYQSNGSLRLGVDGWPDNSPAFSSSNKVPANASAPPSNWVFFAVTYQSNGQVQFYFGNNTTDATLDVTRTYSGRGATGSAINKLAIGAFNDGTRNPGTYDRMFRGLIDDIQIYNSVLTPSTIVEIQRGVGVDNDTTPPTLGGGLQVMTRGSTSASLGWAPASDNVRVVRYIVSGNNTQYFLTASPLTITNLTPGTTYTFTLQAQDAAGNTTAPSPLSFTTLPQDPLIRLLMTDGAGPNVQNSGSLASSFTRSTPNPFSSSLPISGLTNQTMGFGVTPGNYYIESAGVIDGLKNLSAFTITGWINNNSSTAGGGGNRIVSWINNGGDGVDLVYQSDGSLRLGVDGWPDNSPAFSSAPRVSTETRSIDYPNNWTFFAVTYQSNGQVQFYFGGRGSDAGLDVTRTYPGPGITGSNISRLAIGNFNIATRNPSTYDRMFRGFVYDIQIYGSALSLSDIVRVQGRIPAGGGGAIARTDKPLTIEENTELQDELYQNYPNPYSDETIIGVSLRHSVQMANVAVFDLNGRELKNIQVVERGKTNVTITGNEMQAGMYFYRLVADGKVVGTKRMVLTK